MWHSRTLFKEKLNFNVYSVVIHTHIMYKNLGSKKLQEPIMLRLLSEFNNYKKSIAFFLDSSPEVRLY